MLLVLVFACVLLASVLVSELANRSVLSTAVLFLAAGFLLGNGVLGAIEVRTDQNLVASLTELALFSVLFTPPFQQLGDAPRIEIMRALTDYIHWKDYDLIHDHTAAVGPALGAADHARLVNHQHDPWRDAASISVLPNQPGEGAKRRPSRNERPDLFIVWVVVSVSCCSG